MFVNESFQGFVISDWQGIDRITSPPHANYTYSILTGISAGIDMVSFGICCLNEYMYSYESGVKYILMSYRMYILQIMVPYNYTEFIDGLISLVKSNFIPITRIDDAVKRILRVKFTMGLFEHPLADYSKTKYLGSQVRAKILFI